MKPVFDVEERVVEQLGEELLKELQPEVGREVKVERNLIRYHVVRGTLRTIEYITRNGGSFQSSSGRLAECPGRYKGIRVLDVYVYSS